MKKGDGFLIGGVALLAAVSLIFLYGNRQEGARVVIEVDGQETASYPLAEDRTVLVEGWNGGTNLLEIRDGTVTVAEASCPDQLCVHQGSIRYTGQTIVCLPHRVVVTVENGEEAPVDGVAG